MALAVGALPPFSAGWGGTCPQCPPGSYAYVYVQKDVKLVRANT